ncbi:hypothetical protein FsymDg_1316 [Candidatus Protofrankia datiscae]|uniref:Uncharacterized protein n=1 Tax=Candidatus Protofrankia datiscae TaxID=2716812 RepID=F8B162_9ACTN|nr:hypothetical protein FsymDg_1316 [Candidatus Protofrankia datiscae]
MAVAGTVTLGHATPALAGRRATAWPAALVVRCVFSHLPAARSDSDVMMISIGDGRSRERRADAFVSGLSAASAVSAASAMVSGRGWPGLTKPGVPKATTVPALPCMDNCAVSAPGFRRVARPVGPAGWFSRGAKISDTYPVARCPRPCPACPGKELVRHPQVPISVNRCRSPLVSVADRRPTICWEMMSTLKTVAVVSFMIFGCFFWHIIVNIMCRCCPFVYVYGSTPGLLGGSVAARPRPWPSARRPASADRPASTRSSPWPHTWTPAGMPVGTGPSAGATPARGAAGAPTRRRVRRDHP